MRPKAKLYLQGVSSEDGKVMQCPLSSSVIIFMIRYCQTLQFELVFVEDSAGDAISYQIKMIHLSDLPVTFRSWTELPNVVRNVTLPSVHQPELSLVRSGLCVLLRHIVKESHAVTPDRHLIDLLGFREGSLRMCAEVSSWTKLCEVELALSVSQLITSLKYHHGSNKENVDGTSMIFTLPSDLLRLENHFQKKCKIHNDDKKRRAELVRLKEHLSQCSQHINLHSNEERNGTTADTVVKEQFGDIANVGSKSLPHTDQTDHAKISSPTSASDIQIERLSYQNGRLQIDQVTSLHHGVRKFRVDKLFSEDTPQNHLAIDDIQKTSARVSDVRSEKDERFNLNHIKDIENSLDITDLVNKLSYLDIEFLHTYSEGNEMTIADLILLVYVYHLLESLNFKCESLTRHLPNTLRWASHMTSLGTVAEAAQTSGWHMDSLKTCLLSADNHAQVPNKQSNCQQVTFVRDADIVEDEDETELRRCTKIKYKAIKPEVLQTLKKFEAACIAPVTGTHPCGEEVQVDWVNLPPGVSPKEGDVPERRTRRKCQQLENLVTAVQAVARPGDILVDFCSGGGHLGIVMAYLLPECQVYLVENKEESLLKACSRLESLQLKNVTLYQCNLDYFTGKFGVGVCLHACGSATDMVLQLCLNAQASFVICPCCYGSIKKTHLLTYPRSKQFMETNISYKDFLTLGHAADQTEFSIALEERGRHCMNLVDTDRAQYARELGYTVTLCSLSPLSCTPKNNLLIGTLRDSCVKG